MYFATDIECHKGWDGRNYLIDFSRVMPPVKPRFPKQKSHLYELFRPEFIKKYKRALCSDAYSSFFRNQIEARKAKKEVDRATTYLRDKWVPRVAEKIPGRIERESFELTDFLHSRGVCMRYLGLVLAHLFQMLDKCQELASSQSLCITRSIAVVTIEIYARSFNSYVREGWRQKTFDMQTTILSEFRRVIVRNLNLMFGESVISREFWSSFLRDHIVSKFEGLSEYFTTLNQDQFLLPGDRVPLFHRIEAGLGLKMSLEFNADLHEDNRRLYDQERPFAQSDLQEICERIKTLSIIKHAQGFVLMNQGVLKRKNNSAAAIRCFTFAISQFEGALKTSRNNKVVLRDLARTYEYLDQENAQQTKAMGFGSIASPLALKARRFYLKAIAIDPQDPVSLLYYAKFLDRMGDAEAHEYYLKTLEADSSYVSALYEYGNFLAAQSDHAAAEELFAKAKALSLLLPQNAALPRERHLRLSDNSM